MPVSTSKQKKKPKKKFKYWLLLLKLNILIACSGNEEVFDFFGTDGNIYGI